MAMVQPLDVADLGSRDRNFHPNVWDDDLIQSLSSPYATPLYVERRETLIKEIREILKALVDHGDVNPSTHELFERFWIVDVVRRLGIDRYFQHEIRLSLDYAYKYWKDEEGHINGDLNVTALGFLCLRLNRYTVSADVFENFKDGDGKFIVPAGDELRYMLNLHRASELVFPGEKVMKEAKIFTSSYLQQSLQKPNLEINELVMEVEYVLKYPWRCSFPRWETRNYIEIVRQHSNTWPQIKNAHSICDKFIELAILDFNILQSQHQDEVKVVSRWWKDSEAIQLDFVRHRPVEFYFWGLCAMFEPEFCESRIAFGEWLTVLSLTDDIYDTYGTFEELKQLTEAVTKWDMSLTENLPDYMKVMWKFARGMYEKIASEAEKKHGPHVHKHLRDAWKSFILSYLKEAEWIAFEYTPTFFEYIKNGEMSAGMQVAMLFPLVLMETYLSGEILEQLDYPISRFQTIIALIARLVDDVNDFQDEKMHGEIASSIDCYMKDNPKISMEDAVSYINSLVDGYAEELNWEYLKSCHIPASCKSFYFNTGRGLFFLFNDKNDGITNSHKEVKDVIQKVLIDPIKL